MSFWTHIKGNWHWYVFTTCLLLCVAPIFMMDYLITLDGPTHLYNSNLFNHLLQGSEFTNSYFEINGKITPNYISLLLLSLLLAIFNSVIALKIFHLFFVVLFALSFLKWNKISNENPSTKLGFIIFPFIFSYLFFSGFYNFILAILLLFWTLSFYEKTKIKGWKKQLILSLLLITTYFSHSIVFAFVGLAMGIFEINNFIAKRQSTKESFQNIALLLLTALPSLLMMILFMGTRHSATQYLPFSDLLYNLITSKSIVARGIISTWVKHGFILSLEFTSIYFIFQKRQNLSNSSNYLLWTALVSLLLYFTLPDSVGYASVFSVRIEYFFWIFLLAWVSRQAFKKEYINYFFGAFTVLFTIFQLQGNLAFWQPLNTAAKQTLAANDYIENESVVYPIFTSNVWEHFHMSNLLGADKNILILENNGAREDYFPVQYKLPYEKLLDSIPALQIKNTNVMIDYVVKIGKNPTETPRDIIIYDAIRNNGALIFENDMVEVWKRQ